MIFVSNSIFLGKIDRMEALMEKLIEVVYTTQLSAAGVKSVDRTTLEQEQEQEDESVLIQEAPEASHDAEMEYTYQTEEVNEEEEEDEDTLDETDHNYTNVEHIVMEDEIEVMEDDSMVMSAIKKEKNLQIEEVVITPRTFFHINGIPVPIMSMEELHRADKMLSEDRRLSMEIVSRLVQDPKFSLRLYFCLRVSSHTANYLSVV